MFRIIVATLLTSSKSAEIFVSWFIITVNHKLTNSVVTFVMLTDIRKLPKTVLYKKVFGL